jgi:hypothetical protein
MNPDPGTIPARNDKATQGDFNAIDLPHHNGF